MDRVEEETITLGPHSVQTIQEGRQLLRELTVFRELEVPDYREWLVWELSFAALRGKLLADIQIEIDAQLVRLVVEDHLFGTHMEFDLELVNASSGIWQFETHASCQ